MKPRPPTHWEAVELERWYRLPSPSDPRPDPGPHQRPPVYYHHHYEDSHLIPVVLGLGLVCILMVLVTQSPTP